jgi:protein subunit release factor A
LAEIVESDSGEAEELEESLTKIKKSLDKLEFETLLSGPDDHRDAILTIHPGAGGTESQDWADMLFRMYNRWAERRGFDAELMDHQISHSAISRPSRGCTGWCESPRSMPIPGAIPRSCRCTFTR